jgi:UDP-N-acetylmuramoyl-tripeptide--D-alanyl-D-alanine ligase
MRILRGINGSILLDDSYNASPAASEEALGALSLIPKKGKRIALLGDMLELGRYSAEEHARVGKLAAERVDMLIAVGIRSRASRLAAIEAGMKEENVLAFDTAIEAARAIKEHVRENDIVLVKGSQSVRMERVVEELLRNPEDAKLLVRQDPEWKRKK